MICVLTQYCSGDKIETIEIGVEHVVHIGERKGGYRVLVGKPEGKKPLGGRGVDGRIILKWIFRKWNWGGGIDVAQDRVRWQALVNAVMNLRVP